MGFIMTLEARITFIDSRTAFVATMHVLALCLPGMNSPHILTTEAL
jgi:hypothetical protein